MLLWWLLPTSGQTESAFSGVLASPPVPRLGSGYGEAEAADVLFIGLMSDMTGWMWTEGSRHREVRKWTNEDPLAKPFGHTGANVLDQCGSGS